MPSKDIISYPDVAISGISGRFPECSDMEELKNNLFSGIDMVTEDDRRWPLGIYGLPTRNGKLKDISKFDATFFGVHFKQADIMDPQLRILLEVTFEAIVDAGFNPLELRGSRTGVFIGQTFSEAQDYVVRDPETLSGYGLLGSSRCQIANRISFAFDFKGPSYSLDTACSSALYAYAQAVDAIEKGNIDYAVVGGINLLLKPETSLQFHRLNMLSSSGTCKAFDTSGNGYVRSETVGVIFLQRCELARRIYAKNIKAKTNVDGYKDLGITFPSGQMQKRLLLDVFNDINILPTEINYVEAHGTGTKAGDPQELNTIVDVFCEGRNNPLLIGSVKSNLGHSEAAAGIGSLAKVILAMEEGVIPQNIHYSQPNPDIPGLTNGKLKVVDVNWPWEGKYAAINSFGFGGANAHVVLKMNEKNKTNTQNNLDKIIGVTGRTEEAVQHLLVKAKQYHKDADFLSLLQTIHKINIPGHNFRGYTILGPNHVEVEESSTDRQIWFVFSGMGSQFPGMGKSLMEIDIFANSIRNCANVLSKEGIDLLDLIENGEETKISNIINSFVCIAAIQVALVDVLYSLNIHPHGILGHSVGELGCAYADGSFTAEQTVLAACARGKCIAEMKIRSDFQTGAMAAIGATWEETKNMLPEDLFSACHNSKDSVTISGPEASLDKFITKLQKDGIFARKVNSSGFAFHSRYITSAAENLRNSLQKIIPRPKPRTEKWISTSIPEPNWNTEMAQLSSADYHVNNLLSPVLFYEGLQKIPKGSILIEIAPHALLQAILKRALPECINIGLTNKGAENQVNFLLKSLGKLFNSGAAVNFSSLYPPISFPVGRGTPMISPMIKWDHSTNWNVPLSAKDDGKFGESLIEIDLSKDAHRYITGHQIDGRILYPATGYLVLVWKSLAKVQKLHYEDLAVTFEDVSFERATIIPKDGSVKLSISTFKNSGRFEITESGAIVVTGQITDVGTLSDLPELENSTPTVLQKDDFYKELRLRGYEYLNEFRGVKRTNSLAVSGILDWTGNWVTFMDTMLQFSISGENTRELHLPVRIQKIIINPKVHKKILQDKNEILVNFHKNLSIIKSGGVEIRNLKTNLTRRRPLSQQLPTLEKHCFVPYFAAQKFEKETILTIMLQIVIENISATKIKLLELSSGEEILSPTLSKILSSQPQVSSEITVCGGVKHSEALESLSIKTVNKISLEGHHIIVGLKLSKDITELEKKFKPNQFLLTEECEVQKIESSLRVISVLLSGDKKFFLLKKVSDDRAPKYIKVTQKNYKWVEEVKKAMKDMEKIVLYSEEAHCGILGLVNCLRQEPGGENIRCVFMADAQDAKLIKEQLSNDLVFNVLKNGSWGSMRHIKLNEEPNEPVVHGYINTLVRGDLSSLRWIQGPLTNYKQKINNGKTLYTVYYAPLNFRDIMLATGKLPPDALPGDLASQECILGMEFSGRNPEGKRVMGIVEACGLATTVVAEDGFIWDVPNDWSLEQASTVPIAYATAYYALIVRGRLKKGESILIHAGTGGVGQAAISIALSMNCIVYTTVGTDVKREFIKKTFQLDDTKIGNSRNTSFENLVLNETKGRGVNLVLNSLAGEQLKASLRCLSKHGRFLEIGKLDLSNNSPLGMSILLKNTTVHGILLDALFNVGLENPEKKEVIDLMLKGISSGVVKPLPSTSFESDHMEESFRYMASGKHIGKVILKLRNEESELIFKPRQYFVNAIPKTYMDKEKCYILVGGLGGFGLELGSWLIEKGANKLVLVSRSGINNGYKSLVVRKWEQKGAHVLIYTGNPCTVLQARKLFSEAVKLGPIGGIFNLAAVLKDAYIENLTENEFKEVCFPKVDVTQALDLASRTDCPQLNYFVMFSSVSCGRGNAGQANYGMANSTMERIAETRKSMGFPATAIQWGAIGDVGLVMDGMQGEDTIVAGTLPQKISSCLNALDQLLRQSDPVLCSMVVASKGKATNTKDITLVDAIAHILGVKDTKSVGASTLADLGMDSLMGSEIKQTLERNFDILMNAQEIRGLNFPTILKLSNTSSETNPVKIESDTATPVQKLVPVDPIVKLNSKTIGTPVFFIHPIEGYVNMLEELASKINCPAYGLQCTSDAPMSSMHDLACSYVNHIKKIQSKGSYVIVAYSFGSGVGLEMGIILENNGDEVNLIFVDGSNDFTRKHIEIFKKTKGLDKDFEAFKLSYVAMLYSKADFTMVQKELIPLKSFDERLNKCISFMKDFEESDVRIAAESFGLKLKIADAYKPNKKFIGKLTLIKASQNFVALPKDYNIGQYCERPILIYTVEGSHQSILRGEAADRIASVINQQNIEL